MNFHKMPAERFDLCHGLIRLLRLPVAKVDERGDRRGVGKGEHRRIVLSDEPFIYHSGKDRGKHILKSGQKMFRRKISGPLIPELFDREQFSRFDDILIMDREIHHLHCHSREAFR